MTYSRRPAHPKPSTACFWKVHLVHITAVHHWRTTKYVLSEKGKKNRRITAILIVHFGKPFLMVMFLFANADSRWRCDRRSSLWIRDGCFPIEDRVNQLKNYQTGFFFVKINCKNVELRGADSTISYFV